MNGPIRILLVDDELLFSDSLAQILRLAGYEVSTAQRGDEAVALLAECCFDLLLLDVELPDMFGYQIMDSLKGKNSDAVSIMLTGNATVKTVKEALRKGAYDYLKKPVDHELLFGTIKKAIKHGRLEKALRASEERLKTLAEASWEGIILHENGVLLDANKQFFDMFGYREEELLGQPILKKIVSPLFLPEVKTRITNDLIGYHESLALKKDGTEFPIETACRRMEYQGRTVRVCSIRDISSRVNAAQEKFELQRQLTINKKMETLGLMAGSVAHDLNNILSGIVTLPELLLMQMGSDHEHSKSIQTIEKAGREAASVVADLITVARGATVKKHVCNLNELVENYVVASREKKDPRLNNIDVSFCCAPGSLNIYCSRMHINKVLMNLIGNAAEEIEGHGTIVVSVRNVIIEEPFLGYEPIEAGEYVVLGVMDDGPGISQNNIQKIFEPFYSKKVMGRSGTGLGLTIVWNTVHDHDGFLDLKSNKNGTTFNLYFPRTKDAIREKTEILSIEKYRGNGEKILVVDDQEKQQEITSNLLNSLGYKTDTVGSGEEAISYVRMKYVDLVVLDMIMGDGINGRETYKEILKINSSQSAIIVSGFAEDEEVKRTLLLGAKQFVKKPYSLAQLAMAVKGALFEAEQAALAKKKCS